MNTASVSGQALNLPIDFAFDHIRESQITKHNKIKGDCVPEIGFPDTPRNRAVLQNPALFELKRDGVKEFPNFELKVDGYDLIRGTLVLNNGLNGFVRGTIGNISAKNAKKLITDYNLPTNKTFINKTSYSPDTDDYDCPTIINNDFFKDITQVYTLIVPGTEQVYENTKMQRYHRNRGYMVNYKNEGLIEISDGILHLEYHNPDVSTNAVTPFLYLFNTIKLLLQKNGIYLNANELAQNHDLSKILIYNNLSLIEFTPINADFTTVQYGDVFFEQMVICHIINWLTQSLGNFNYKDLLPPIPLRDFILGIQNLINIAIVFNDNGTADIIDREAVVEKAPVDIDKYFTGIWELGEKKNVELHFTMQHDNNDAYFGSYYHDLTDREADFGDDLATFAELEAIQNPVQGELRRVLSENRIYEYKTETVVGSQTQKQYDVTRWVFASIDFQTYKYNREEGVDKEVEEINTTFSTLADKNNSHVLQLGRCNLRRNQEATFTPRVFFNIEGYGKNNTSNYYLNWRGEKNLIDTRWKKWAKFWANRESATGYFRLPAYMLQNFNMNVPYKTRQGTFLIDRMVTRITHAGIGETKMEVFKL